GPEEIAAHAAPASAATKSAGAERLMGLDRPAVALPNLGRREVLVWDIRKLVVGIQRGSRSCGEARGVRGRDVHSPGEALQVNRTKGREARIEVEVGPE